MSPILGIFASQGRVSNSYESIQTYTLGSSQASVTFSSIPSTYKHLQVRIISRTDRSANEFDGSNIRFNSDSGSNYAYHRLFGDGSTVTSDSFSTQTSGYVGTTMGGGGITNAFSCAIIDVLDYANTNKNKTVRTLSGRDNNASSGSINFASSLWMNTSAITSITILTSVGPNFVANSSFALYGIRG